MSFIDQLKQMPGANLLGLISPFIGLSCILLATLILPGFDWASNALSDLGSWYRTDLGEFQVVSAILFNGGLIVTSLLIIIYVVSLLRALHDWPTKLAFVAFLGTLVFLTSVGIFSEDFILPHIYAALLFFLSIPIALGLAGLSWVRFPELRKYALLSIIMAVVSYLVIFQSWASIAVRELAEALIAIFWSWGVNYLHMKGKLSILLGPS